MGAPWPPRGPDDLDDEGRARMRREVLARVEPRGPGFGDHAYAVLTVLAAPAPFIVRAAVSGVLVLALVATASVASADALPDEPLYGVKVASEQVRLALARSPEDRAAVWLSMAEHRLSEAERLAVSGREPEALVATSAYGTQLAEAAAELAAIERLEEQGPSVVARLRDRLADQQLRAADVAERLRTGKANSRSAPAFDTVASAPPAEASGTVSELIAEHAASVTDQVAAVAEQRAVDQAAAEAPAAEAPAAAAAPPQARPAAPPAVRAVPEPARPDAAPRDAPAPAAARESQGVGAVTLPDPTPTPTATPKETATEAPKAADRPKEDPRQGGPAKTDDDEREDDGRSTEKAEPEARTAVGEKLSDISKRFKAAIEQIREKQKQAREALEKAKERGKKAPSPKPKREDDD